MSERVKEQRFPDLGRQLAALGLGAADLAQECPHERVLIFRPGRRFDVEDRPLWSDVHQALCSLSTCGRAKDDCLADHSASTSLTINSRSSINWQRRNISS